MEDGRPLDEVPVKPTNWRNVARNSAYILLALLIFLFALDLMMSSLQHLGKSAAETIIFATSNPFTALFIGLLVTAIIQSSTATTSMTVALVASGSLTLQSAVPIVMGANIGTTITSTIVSLGFVARKKEFRRAVSMGTYHDFFNILTASVLFPLEYYFQFLSSLAQSLAEKLFNQPVGATQTNFNLLGGGLSWITDWITLTLNNGFLVTVVSLVILYSSILFFRKVITDMLGFGVPDRFQHFFFNQTWKSFGWGFLTTAAIRSSTVTTSLVVPLVAKKVVRLRKAAPFIIGANIGTTISAMLAAMVNSNTAISIALAHVLFNLLGMLLFFILPGLRELPIGLARALGRLTMHYRMVGFIYLLLTFFIIPFSLIYFNQNAVTVTSYTYQRTTKNETHISTVISRASENSFVSNCIEYPEHATTPSRLYTVYHKGQLLIIDHELYELSRSGFCRDGEDTRGKFTQCVSEIVPKFQLTSSLAFDSVFVFERRYERDSLIRIRTFISRQRHLLLKQEVFDDSGNIVGQDELIRIEEP